MTGKPKGPDGETQRRADKQRFDDDTAERPYYYDDAHGYEEFDPDLCEEEDDAGQAGSEEFALGRVRRG